MPGVVINNTDCFNMSIIMFSKNALSFSLQSIYCHTGGIGNKFKARAAMFLAFFMRLNGGNMYFFI